MKKLRNAIPCRAEHVNDYIEFSDSIPAASILEWSSLVECWEKDNSQVNPFVPTVKSTYEVQCFSVSHLLTSQYNRSNYSTRCSASSG